MRLQTRGGTALFHPFAQQRNSAQSLAASSFTKIAVDELSLSAHHENITIDRWAIFPDGLHILIRIKDHSSDAHAASSKPRLLTSFVARLKAAIAKRINLLRNQPGASVWQPSYKEQRIQDETTLSQLTKYISSSKDIVVSSRGLSS